MTLLKGEYNVVPVEKVAFGVGSLESLPAEVARYGAQRVALYASRTLRETTDLVARVERLLGPAHAGTFSDTTQHVPRKTVLAAAEFARQVGADALVTFGGGSVTDLVKGVAMCLAADIHDLDGLDRMRIRFTLGGPVEIPSLPRPPIPHIAIPTTLSAGEFTNLIGITDEVRRVKDLFLDRNLVPGSIILDPEVTVATPPWLWASTGMRSVDHAIEGLCSTTAQPVTDALSADALDRLARHLPGSAADPLDFEAKAQCQIAAWESIFGLVNVLLGLSHGIGHQLGARCNVPHGVTSCVMLPTVMRFNLAHTTGPQARIARIFATAGRGDAGLLAASDEVAAAAAGPAVRAFVELLGLPGRLRDVGVTEADFAGIAADALDDIIVAGNPRPVSSADEVVALLREAF